MPYISPEQRAELDPAIHLMLKALAHTPPSDVQDLAGKLNYVITRLILDSFFRYGPRYHLIATALGALETCKLEMYRRLAVDYERQKCYDNGDVYPEPETCCCQKSPMAKGES